MESRVDRIEPTQRAGKSCQPECNHDVEKVRTGKDRAILLQFKVVVCGEDQRDRAEGEI